MNGLVSLSAYGLGSQSSALSWYENVMTLNNQARQWLSSTLLSALCKATEATSLLKYKLSWKGWDMLRWEWGIYMLGWGSKWWNRGGLSTLWRKWYYCWELVAKRPKITREKLKKYIIRPSDKLEHWSFGYKSPSDLKQTFSFGDLYGNSSCESLSQDRHTVVAVWWDLPQKNVQIRFWSLSLQAALVAICCTRGIAMWEGCGCSFLHTEFPSY